MDDAYSRDFDSKIWSDAECVIATGASNVGVAGVLLQKDPDGNLRPCVYWARKLKDAKTRYVANGREA